MNDEGMFYNLHVGGVEGISTIDYPGKVVSVVFLCGCPLRCPFCQNKPLVTMDGCKEVSVHHIVNKVMEECLLISGVCITGGEPFMQFDGLHQLIKILKNEFLFIKIDTNGFYSARLKSLGNIIDFVSVDIKAPPEKYGRAIGRQKLKSKSITELTRTINVLRYGRMDYEFRTTIVPELNDSKEDIIAICEYIKPYILNKKYILQPFRSEKGTLHPYYENLHPPSLKKLLKLKDVAQRYIENVEIRGIEE
jgi:pyruvate formate lyase activating enzyme